MLKMTHLSKVYRTEVVETYALRDFNINVTEGEFVAVTGPSGSGKTTFLTIAGLLETFTGGEYHLDGVEVSRLDDNARSKIRNEKIGFIFQAFNLIPDLNVYDNVEVPLRYRGMKAAERKQRIMDALERVGLASRAKHYPAELSGGQQQRVAIARALAGSPRLLLADEPTGNLDTQMARGVMELLEEIHREGATIVMVTHDPELAARAQRNVHIIDGQVVDLAEDPRFHAQVRAADVRLLFSIGCAQSASQSRADCADDHGDRFWRGRIDDYVFGISGHIEQSDSAEVLGAVRTADRQLGAGGQRQRRTAFGDELYRCDGAYPRAQGAAADRVVSDRHFGGAR
jgi:putative ABC transport system ATP-binding protein